MHDYNFIADIYLKGLHETFRPRLGDGTQVVDEIGLGHSNTGVTDGQRTLGQIRDNLNVHIFAAVQL